MADFFQPKSSVLIPLNIGANMDEDDYSNRLLDESGNVSASSWSYESLKERIIQSKTCLLYSFVGLVAFCVIYATFFGRRGDESWSHQMKVLNSTAAVDPFGNTWIESSIGVNGIMVDYYRSVPSKPGLPKLVFFHGGGTSGSEGIEIFGPLANQFEVICPSARGFGRTTRAPPFGTAQMVKDAVALLPLFRSMGEKFFLVAHSMGATVAPRVAKEIPELVAALVLEDPGWLRREGEDPSKNPPGSHPRGGDDLSNESVENILVPTLILTAEHGDGVPKVIDAAISTYPTGTKHYFKGADHCIHCKSSNGYLEVVKEYLLKNMP